MEIKEFFFEKCFFYKNPWRRRDFKLSSNSFFLSRIGNPGKAWIVIWLIAAAATAAAAAAVN